MKIFVYPLLDICECNTSQEEAHERKVEKTYSMLSALRIQAKEPLLPGTWLCSCQREERHIEKGTM